MPKRALSGRSRTDVVDAFGRAIRERRMAIGLTQEELAAAAKVHRTYVGDLERGTRNVALRNMHRLVRALGMTLGEFFVEFNIDA